MLPRTAVALLEIAVCTACALQRERDEAALEQQRYQDQRQGRLIEAARARVEQAAPMIVSDGSDEDALVAPVGNRRGLVVVADSSARAEHAAWRHLWLVASHQPARIRSIGGGPESLTLAAATRAGFADADQIRRTYLSPRYTAVLVSGVGSGGYLNATRRFEEWGALLDSVERSGQYLVVSSGVGQGTGSASGRDFFDRLASWVGPEAAGRLKSLTGQAVFLP